MALRRTATILKNPMIAVRIPPAITTLHNGRPRFWMLVAGLLRFPKILKPRANIDVPRKTKPCSELSKGQSRAKYDLKTLSSETMRNMEMTLVMKWDTPSKR